MSEMKSLSIQEEEILMEQIWNYPCLYDKSKMSYKERDVNKNAWSKVALKLAFIQNGIYECRYEKFSDCCASPMARGVRARLSAAEIHFLKACVICCNECRKYRKIRYEEYLLYLHNELRILK